MTFDDASSISMQDRETLLYEEPNHSVLIWFDVKPGFFSRGRVLYQSTIQEWKESPPGNDQSISAAKQQEIIAKVRQYWGSSALDVK